MSKGKRRREARRKARQRREERQEEQTPLEEGVSAEAAGPGPARPRREEEPVHAAAATGAGHSRAARKRAKRRGGLLARVGRMRVSPWLIATPVVAIVVVVIVVLVLSGGSSGSSGASPTPDPRVAGQTPVASVSLNVDDVNFSNTELTGNAEEVIELVVTNTGTISHNLTVAGPDNEYGTGDDFESQPFAIKPGETGRVVLKIDDPGTYLFRCAFHPGIEFGTLVLQ